MNPVLAARVASAVSARLWVDVEVRAPGGGTWRTVRGLERRATIQQRPDGLVTQLLVESDEVHLLAADWPSGGPRPGPDWQVRFADGRVRALSEPMRTVDSAGLFLAAPIV